MAFFVVKSMTHIFGTSEGPMSRSSSQTSSLDLPSTLHKSDIPIIAAAIDGHFASEWESQLYKVILRVFQRSMLDESVPIGTVVLLDLLGDLYKKGQFVDGDRSRCILAPYPQEDYIRYFKGAFMLAVRLLSQNKLIKSGYWEQVMREDDMTIDTEIVVNIENDFRRMLEENINYYPTLPISPDDPAYQFHYAGDLAIPPNAFIARLRYLRTKSTMYSHIRVLMTSRGEASEVLTIDPRTKAMKKDLDFPPCHEYMMGKLIQIEETRKLERNLRGATNKQVHDYIEKKAL